MVTPRVLRQDKTCGWRETEPTICVYEQRSRHNVTNQQERNLGRGQFGVPDVLDFIIHQQEMVVQKDLRPDG